MERTARMARKDAEERLALRVVLAPEERPEREDALVREVLRAAEALLVNTERMDAPVPEAPRDAEERLALKVVLAPEENPERMDAEVLRDVLALEDYQAKAAKELKSSSKKSRFSRMLLLS